LFELFQEFEMRPITGPYLLPLEIIGMELDKIIPLTVIQFFAIEDLNKSFCMRTSFGKVR